MLLLKFTITNTPAVNPAPVRAIDALRACTKMFQSAAQNVDVELEVVADDSLQNLAIDFVLVDASRIDQIIINLLTNAVCHCRLLYTPCHTRH